MKGLDQNSIVQKKRRREFQGVDGLDESSNVYKNRARIRMISVEGLDTNSSFLEIGADRSINLYKSVCIKIGPEFQCLEEKDDNSNVCSERMK